MKHLQTTRTTADMPGLCTLGCFGRSSFRLQHQICTRQMSREEEAAGPEAPLKQQNRPVTGPGRAKASVVTLLCLLILIICMSHFGCGSVGSDRTSALRLPVVFPVQLVTFILASNPVCDTAGCSKTAFCRRFACKSSNRLHIHIHCISFLTSRAFLLFGCMGGTWPRPSRCSAELRFDSLSAS